MISIAHCDDNSLQCELFAELLREYARQRLLDVSVDTYPDGEKLLLSCRAGKKYDIYILDCVMPGMSGIEVASMLRESGDDGHIVFLSSSGDYAAASYDVGATYYLMKPVEHAKLYRILDGIVEKMPKAYSSFTFHTGSGDVNLGTNHVMYITLSDRKAHLAADDGNVYTSPVLRGSFKNEVEPLLENSSFCFGSAATLINLEFVQSMDELETVMKDNTILQNSRAYYQGLKKAWAEFEGRDR